MTATDIAQPAPNVTDEIIPTPKAAAKPEAAVKPAAKPKAAAKPRAKAAPKAAPKAVPKAAPKAKAAPKSGSSTASGTKGRKSISISDPPLPVRGHRRHAERRAEVVRRPDRQVHHLARREHDVLGSGPVGAAVLGEEHPHPVLLGEPEDVGADRVDDAGG